MMPSGVRTPVRERLATTEPVKGMLVVQGAYDGDTDYFSGATMPAPKPTTKGMTDEEIDAAWDAHLRHRGHE